ncbi:MAG: hypothetical protein K2X66_06190 [Cyanobacteria bacterium]|nr:hypothetical protein [Cyanobacteriota bacterium]
MFHPIGPKIMSPLDAPNRQPSPAGASNSFAPQASNNQVNGNSPGSSNAAPSPGNSNTQQAAPAKEMVAVSSGGGSGCLMCVGMKNGMIPKEKLEQIKTEMFDKIMAHEQAHSSAAGAFGGAIHIDYDSNGIAVGGHVPIMIPGLSKMNPEESLKAYETIYGAATAPGDPSGQDMSVAAQAQDLMGRAKVAIDKKATMMAKAGAAGTTNGDSANGGGGTDANSNGNGSGPGVNRVSDVNNSNGASGNDNNGQSQNGQQAQGPQAQTSQVQASIQPQTLLQQNPWQLPTNDPRRPKFQLAV